MSQDYAALKVPDLKKLLNERGLIQTGNKADLVARLQENDAKGTFQHLRSFSTHHALRRQLHSPFSAIEDS